MKILPVIMSGGAGTRLWPLSRIANPKQYHVLGSKKSMIVETAKRFETHLTGVSFLAPAFICASTHQPVLTRQLEEEGIKPSAILYEPFGRNTAPVAGFASALAEKWEEDVLILLLPADHHIEDTNGFIQAVADGAEAAATGSIVTFGIKPAHPETGYGYIESAEALEGRVYKVARFTEKPDQSIAEQYIAAGNFYWNSGIFLFSPSTMVSELEKCAPEIASHSKSAFLLAKTKNHEFFLDAGALEACPADSIDYAVMEHTDRAAVVAPVDIGWNDLGSWKAVKDVSGRDYHGDNAISISGTDNFIVSDGPLVTTVGVNNLVIVATKDAILVADPDKSQDVKKVVEQLKKAGKGGFL